MSRLLITSILIFAVTAALYGCTPADEEYCTAMGVGGSAEWGKCIDYFHAQQQLFSADRAVCDMQADQTYPPSLYDHGGYVSTFGGPFYGGPFGPVGGSAFVEPDYRKNAEIDQLRLRIVGPCMAVKGWNSPTSWQAGRHAVAVAPVRKTPVATVPLRKTILVAPTPTPSSLNSLPWIQ